MLCDDALRFNGKFNPALISLTLEITEIAYNDDGLNYSCGEFRDKTTSCSICFRIYSTSARCTDL